MLLTRLELSLMIQLTQGSREQLHIYVCSFDRWIDTKRRLGENEKQFQRNIFVNRKEAFLGKMNI